MREEWVNNSLSQLTEFIKDGTHGTHQDVEVGIPLLSAKDVSDGVLTIPNDARKISESDYLSIHKTYLIEIGDILLTIVGSIGRSAIVKDSSRKFTVQRSVGILRPERKRVDANFLFYTVQSEEFQKQLERAVNASAQGGVYLGSLAKLRITLPQSLPTQQKIARILSTLDGVIARTEAIVAKYTAIKAGLLQDLFTRGIDANGQLRPSPQEAPDLYKESVLGLIPKEWEVVELNSLVERIFVGIATSSSGFFSDTGVLFLRNQNIKENRVDLSDVLFIKQEFADSNASKYLSPNDVITVRTGYPGQSAVVPKELEGSQTFTTLITRPNPKLLDSFFLSFFMNSELGKKQVYSLQGGGAQQNLNSGELETLKIFRLDIDEQRLIVSRLQQADVNIQTEQAYLTKLQGIRAGLMADLLTGKVEVSALSETLTNAELVDTIVS